MEKSMNPPITIVPKGILIQLNQFEEEVIPHIVIKYCWETFNSEEFDFIEVEEERVLAKLHYDYDVIKKKYKLHPPYYTHDQFIPLKDNCRKALKEWLIDFDKHYEKYLNEKDAWYLEEQEWKRTHGNEQEDDEDNEDCDCESHNLAEDYRLFMGENNLLDLVYFHF